MNFLTKLLKLILFFCVVANSQTKISALENFAQIDSLAKFNYNSASLMYVRSNNIDTVGVSNFWEYAYWGHDSTGMHEFTYMIVGGTLDLIDSTDNSICCIRGIQATWINSDSATIIAEENGGRQFRQACKNFAIHALMSVPSGSPDYGPAYWTFRYKDLGNVKNELIIEINATEGKFTGKWATQVEAKKVEMQTYALYQAYPNPSNSNAVISFIIPEYTFTELNIYNIQGQLIANLMKRDLPAGKHSIIWNSSGCPAGMYLYQLKTNDTNRIGKITLQK